MTTVYRDRHTGAIYATFPEHAAGDPQLIKVGLGDPQPYVSGCFVRDALEEIPWDGPTIPLDAQCPRCAERIRAAKAGAL